MENSSNIFLIFIFKERFHQNCQEILAATCKKEFKNLYIKCVLVTDVVFLSFQI